MNLRAFGVLLIGFLASSVVMAAQDTPTLLTTCNKGTGQAPSWVIGLNFQNQTPKDVLISAYQNIAYMNTQGFPILGATGSSGVVIGIDTTKFANEAAATDATEKYFAGLLKMSAGIYVECNGILRPQPGVSLSN